MRKIHHNLTKAEIKDELFNQNVDSIKNIYFEKTVHDIAICRNIFFDKGKVYAQKYDEFSKYDDYEIEELQEFKTEHFIKAIKDLHLGEWRKNYDMSKHGLVVFDGTHWKLEINFGSGYVEKFHGHSTYPYNFELLEMLLNFNAKAFGIILNK